MNTASHAVIYANTHFVSRFCRISLKDEQNKPEHHTKTAGLHLHGVTFAQIYYNQTIKRTQRKYTRSTSQRILVTLRDFILAETSGENRLLPNKYIKVSLT